MASCVRNIHTKNYQNLIIGFQVTVKNVGDAFLGTQCIHDWTQCANYWTMPPNEKKLQIKKMIKHSTE